MNLLEEGIQNLTVKPTVYKKQLIIDNHTDPYAVYEIRLDQLYYNDQNDRIATWVSKYTQDNNVDSFDLSDLEKYNQIIEEFIVESNPAAIEKTKRNIMLVGQQEYGVVLNDGRIIDGNRRFTCLRQIQRETNQTQYFKAVILPHNYEKSAKQIKILELQLQLGVDRPVDYDVVNKLVGLYKTIVEEKLLTVEEYSNSIGEKNTKAVERELELAYLMVDFLDFINAPRQFHIAQKLHVYESLKEIKKMLANYNGNDDAKEDLKSVLFTQLLLQPADDMSRGFLRKVDKIVKNQKFSEEYIDEQMPTVEKVVDNLDQYPSVDEKIINNTIRTEEAKKQVTDVTEKYYVKVTSDTSRNEPIRRLHRAYDELDSIDTLIFLKMNDSQREEVSDAIHNIASLLDKIRGDLDV